MVVGRRLLAVASAAALAGSMAAVIGSAAQAATGPPGTGVTFTSQAGAVTFTHYTVTPQGRGTSSGANSNAEGRISTLSPKGDRNRNRRTDSGGVDSNNTVSSSEPSTSTPGTSASFIGQQGSATTCSYFGLGCNPPDMALAASSRFVLQGVNTQWQVWDTAGNVQAGSGRPPALWAECPRTGGNRSPEFRETATARPAGRRSPPRRRPPPQSRRTTSRRFCAGGA